MALKWYIVKNNEMQNSSEFLWIILPVPHGTQGYGGVWLSSSTRININGKQAIIRESFFKLCYSILNLENKCLNNSICALWIEMPLIYKWDYLFTQNCKQRWLTNMKCIDNERFNKIPDFMSLCIPSNVHGLFLLFFFGQSINGRKGIFTTGRLGLNPGPRG